jgi:TM2 domain-containing membrane protein YozV
MHCRNCGKEVLEEAVVCVNCGMAPTAGNSFCQNCGGETTAVQEVCLKCGVRLVTRPIAGAEAKSKLVAGMLGILLGSFGIHRFYLGYTTIGIIQCVLGVLGILTCGILLIPAWIWGLVEGIMILLGSGGFTKDAQGNPLKD